jgi:hypothetical protein
LPAISVEFAIDDDADVDDPELFLVIPSGTNIFNYALDFTSAAESDFDTTTLEDFEDEKINILGSDYTITQAFNQTGGTMKLTLMRGAIQTTQEVGETKTYNVNGKDYEVTVMVVSGDTSATAITKMIINDEVTKSLSKDDTFKLKDGVEVGIKEVLPTKAGDVQQNLVEFFLGASKIVLDGQNNRMEIGEEVVNDVTVTITGSQTSSEKKLNKIEIDWVPTDNYYVPVGGKLSEVVTDDDDYIAFLKAFSYDLQFAGLEPTNTETIKLTPSGSDQYKLQFTNRKGVKYDEKVFYYNSSASTTIFNLGESNTKTLHAREGDKVCDNDKFIVEFNKHSRILELTNVQNGTEDTISIKDLGTGKTEDYSWTDGPDPKANIVMDGATYTVNVTDDSAKCVLLANTAQGTSAEGSKGDYAALWTEYDTRIEIAGGNISSGGGPNNLSSAHPSGYNFSGHISIKEDLDGKEDSTSDVDVYYLNFSYDSTSTEMRLDTSGFSAMAYGTGQSGVLISLDSNDNTNEGMTPWGNWIRQENTDDQDKWEFQIRENEAVAEVFITAGSTTVTSGDSVSGEAVVIQKIDAGATKLASEVRGQEKNWNLVLVGGPCANPAVEAASADFPTCSGWSLDPGEALIQLVEQSNGNVALLIAGTLAEDTRSATKLVSEGDALRALPDGVWAQVLTVSTGVLMDMEEPVMVAAADDTAADDAAN